MSRRPGGETAALSRIARAPGLTGDEANALAGLLDAEGCFSIAPNNRTGWRCQAGIALRDDDGALLESICSRSGLGHLVPVPARNGSRAQVHWIVQTKTECLALAAVLDDHPLRGRKSVDHAIWRDAVSLWGATRYGLSPGVRARIATLASALHRSRGYDPAKVRDVPPYMGDDGAPAYFAGFFSGEGHFRLDTRHARFVVKLRRDDKPLLMAFQRRFGLGSVVDVAVPPPWSPAAVWHVVSARDVGEGIAVFDSVQLLGRKARQYAAWRPGALAIATAILHGTDLEGDVVGLARRDLARASAYPGAAQPPLCADPVREARAAYCTVLQEWAAVVEGPLSCGAYAVMRRREHPGWPTRTTIACTFGSWYEALAAAGLEDRAARGPRAPR